MRLIASYRESQSRSYVLYLPAPWGHTRSCRRSARMAEEPIVTYELDGDVALVGLNRDEFRNAINGELLDLLREAVIRANDEARAGVIFSHGEKHFSAGLDLAEALAGRNRDEGDRPRQRPSKWHNTYTSDERRGGKE